MLQQPELIYGSDHTDARGIISFINDLHLDKVKRFYLIEPASIDIVRAWQGHKTEQKWFYVVAGSFKIAVVQPDNWESPSCDLEVREFILKGSSVVLHIPGGYANGFKAMEPHSRIMVFSDFTIEDSARDDHRFDSNLWHKWH